MRESEIEKILVDEIRKMGGRAFKWVSPGNDGVPDRIVVLKTVTGKLTSLQRVQVGRLQKMGQDVRVLYGEKETRTFLEECRRKVQDEI